MRNPIPLIALLTLVTACKGEPGNVVPDGGNDPDPVDTDVPVEEDTTRPYILGSTPEQGDLGQRSDVQVVIDFSEPMDAASVEAALDVSDLGDVTLSWNADGDQLTITPVDGLAYADGIGQDNAAVAALGYAVAMDTTATDLAGNPLEDGLYIEFDTLRELGGTLYPDDAMTRSLTPSEVLFDTTDPLVIGDDDGDQGIRAAITFDLLDLPSGTREITSAVLATRQLPGETWGTPWLDLGSSVHLSHVTFPDLDTEAGINAAYNATQTSLSDHDPFAVEGQVVIELDITEDVADDLANRATRNDRSQFIAHFDAHTDVDGEDDRTVISRDLMELQVTFLVP